ncbi:MAG: energy transducer TonB [Rhizomicrobium sp.]
MTTSPITVSDKPAAASRAAGGASGRDDSGVHRAQARLYGPVSVDSYASQSGRDNFIVVQVTPDGNVSDVTVAKSSGFDSLDNAAVSCAGHWHYKPATQDGQAVETSWQANVQWKIPR